ncbi:uncharacterized protein LOC115894853 [Rhinopithecus roxellana]|uniref:uncharacterized protein LOC115894853 n=1 Tax=Rhinopithecus roxellana TaxID=61622 RepID=UPI0012371234|nr:uncharacterized protein LOC115894853 [Rhinopithecus roxellana]
MNHLPAHRCVPGFTFCGGMMLAFCSLQAVSDQLCDLGQVKSLSVSLHESDRDVDWAATVLARDVQGVTPLLSCPVGLGDVPAPGPRLNTHPSEPPGEGCRWSGDSPHFLLTSEACEKRYWIWEQPSPTPRSYGDGFPLRIRLRCQPEGLGRSAVCFSEGILPGVGRAARLAPVREKLWSPLGGRRPWRQPAVNLLSLSTSLRQPQVSALRVLCGHSLSKRAPGRPAPAEPLRTSLSSGTRRSARARLPGPTGGCGHTKRINY